MRGKEYVQFPKRETIIGEREEKNKSIVASVDEEM